MIQLVDIILLAIDALLTVMRKTLMIAFLKCLVYPFVTLNNTLYNVHRAYAVDYISWGSQVWLLEKLLNQKFNDGSTGTFITIDDGNRPDRIYLYFTSSNRPLYMNDVVYGHTADFYLNNSWDFTVNIPNALSIDVDDPRIIQMLNRYKLAGKKYKIIIT